MDIKSKILTAAAVLAVAVSIAYTFYATVLEGDFTVVGDEPVAETSADYSEGQE